MQVIEKIVQKKGTIYLKSSAKVLFSLCIHHIFICVSIYVYLCVCVCVCVCGLIL